MKNLLFTFILLSNYSYGQGCSEPTSGFQFPNNGDFMQHLIWSPFDKSPETWHYSGGNLGEYRLRELHPGPHTYLNVDETHECTDAGTNSWELRAENGTFSFDYTDKNNNNISYLGAGAFNLVIEQGKPVSGDIGSDQTKYTKFGGQIVKSENRGDTTTYTPNTREMSNSFRTKTFENGNVLSDRIMEISTLIDNSVQPPITNMGQTVLTNNYKKNLASGQYYLKTETYQVNSTIIAMPNVQTDHSKYHASYNEFGKKESTYFELKIGDFTDKFSISWTIPGDINTATINWRGENYTHSEFYLEENIESRQAAEAALADTHSFINQYAVFVHPIPNLLMDFFMDGSIPPGL